jgi:hypothetical protein
VSIGQIINQLTLVKTELQHLPQAGQQATTSLSEASALINSVLDAVSDKRLAGDIAQHGPALTAAFTSVQAALQPIDQTITRFRSVRG